MRNGSAMEFEQEARCLLSRAGCSPELTARRAEYHRAASLATDALLRAHAWHVRGASPKHDGAALSRSA